MLTKYVAQTFCFIFHYNKTKAYMLFIKLFIFIIKNVSWRLVVIVVEYTPATMTNDQ